MSLFTKSFSFLGVRPSLRTTPDSLIIETWFLLQALTLFSFCRRTVIEPGHRRLTISTRKLWVLNFRKRLDFDELSHIDYEFSAVETLERGPLVTGFQTQDQGEIYSVRLVTKDGKQHRVCTFLGHGSVETGVWGVLMGDSIIDFRGRQGEDSSSFTEMLGQVLGIRVGHMSEESFQSHMYTCPGCGRSTSRYSPKCLYCGAILNSPLANLQTDRLGGAAARPGQDEPASVD